MNVDSDDYGDANFVTGLIIQDIYPDDGVQYGGGHTVCANDADLGTVGLKGGICRPDPEGQADGICDDGLECRDGRCRTKLTEEESSDVTEDAVAPINHNCFQIPMNQHVTSYIRRIEVIQLRNYLLQEQVVILEQ